MSSDLEIILELGELDRKLAPVRRRLDAVTRLAAPQEARQREVQGTLHAVEEQLKAGTLQAKQLEGDAKAKQAEIDKAQTALNQCKANDEYQALLRQIEQKKGELSAIETRVLEAMFAQETRQAEKAQAQARLKEVEKELQAARGRVAEERVKVEQELKGLEAQRTAVLVRLGDQARELYTRIVERLGDSATAEVIDENCQGCFMKVRPEQLSQLRAKNQLITCFTCGRIMFRNV